MAVPFKSANSVKNSGEWSIVKETINMINELIEENKGNQELKKVLRELREKVSRLEVLAVINENEKMEDG